MGQHRYPLCRHLPHRPVRRALGSGLQQQPDGPGSLEHHPAWGVPFISSPFAPGPAASTLLEGSQGWGPGQIVGAGGYVFINDMVYLELTGYGATSKSFQWAVTGGPPGNLLSGVAPYYRVAVEKNWGEHSLEIGAYGINANVITGGNQALPVGTFGWPTDVITDTGLDLQYQWISDVHAVTLRANYIYERQGLTRACCRAFPPTIRTTCTA